MNAKYRFFRRLSEYTAHDIVSKRGSWTNFLDSAAKMYKYSFAEQLLIHAQRPNAAACATFEMWNEKLGRRIRAGSKGIALIDDSSTRPRLKYVFDVADTYIYKINAPTAALWELKEKHKPLVLSELAKIYDDVDPNSLFETFNNIAKQMATEYYEDNKTELRYRSENSFLEDYDDDNFRAAFVDSVSSSMVYMLLARCGFDTEEYFDEYDFDHISSFNTPDIIHSLGEAASDLSEQVLRDVELVVKKYERQKFNEAALKIINERTIEDEYKNNRADNSREDGHGILPRGGLSSSEHTADGGSGRDTAREIRHDEEKLPENPPKNNLRTDVVQGNPLPPLQGDGAIGTGASGASAERDFSESEPARQGGRPDGLDGGDEHNQSPSGGIGPPRTDLRRDLTENQSPEEIISPENNQPTEKNQAPGENPTSSQLDNTPKTSKPPDLSENLIKTLSTSSLSADEVDCILRDGGNSGGSVLRIAAHFAKNLPPGADADFLRDEYLRGRHKHNSSYYGGKGFQFGNDKISVWFDENGITIGRGDSALYARGSAQITWDRAAERIRQLYDSGLYINHDVLEEALHNEHVELAEDLLDLYRFDFRDFREVPENWGWQKSGWPETVEHITGLLKDGGEYAAILESLREDVSAFEAERKTNTSLRRR